LIETVEVFYGSSQPEGKWFKRRRSRAHSNSTGSQSNHYLPG